MICEIHNKMIDIVSLVADGRKIEDRHVYEVGLADFGFSIIATIIVVIFFSWLIPVRYSYRKVNRIKFGIGEEK